MLFLDYMTEKKMDIKARDEFLFQETRRYTFRRI